MSDPAGRDSMAGLPLMLLPKVTANSALHPVLIIALYGPVTNKKLYLDFCWLSDGPLDCRLEIPGRYRRAGNRLSLTPER